MVNATPSVGAYQLSARVVNRDPAYNSLHPLLPLVGCVYGTLTMLLSDQISGSIFTSIVLNTGGLGYMKCFNNLCNYFC